MKFEEFNEEDIITLSEEILMEEQIEFNHDFGEYFGAEIFFKLLPLWEDIKNLREGRYETIHIINGMLYDLEKVHDEELGILNKDFDETALKELPNKLNINITTSNKLLDYFFMKNDVEGYLIIQKYKDVVFEIVKDVELLILRYENMKKKQDELELHCRILCDQIFT